MSGKIKDFFKKKKVEAKFKLAGGGNKLGEVSSSQQGGVHLVLVSRSRQLFDSIRAARRSRPEQLPSTGSTNQHPQMRTSRKTGRGR